MLYLHPCTQALEVCAGYGVGPGASGQEQALPLADGQALAGGGLGQGALAFQHQQRGEGGLVADILKIALYGIHREVITLRQMAVEVLRFRRLPAGNIQRLRDEVVAPARAGQAFSYQAYSCREGAYLPPRSLGPAPLVIVEGSYSHHPSLAPYYDIRIFVTCSPDEQARRLRKREGELYSNFVERWIPLEEGYFANYSIEENAEMMVVTD